MSDQPTPMYRLDRLAAKGEDDFQAALDMEDWLLEKKVLVSVVPCVHGNYARHLLTVLENFERVYCDGVGKGDNDE